MEGKIIYLIVENEPDSLVYEKKGNNEKSKKDLDHIITVDLEEGIKKTIEWQKKIYKIK